MSKNDPTDIGVVIGLDVGDVRIGVARAHSIARLPEVLEVLNRTKTDPFIRLKELAYEHSADAFVIGIPAYKSGQEGSQAAAIREFAAALQKVVPIPQIFVDESFTSKEADRYLSATIGKNEVSNDALAACIILERYFTEGAHV